MDRSLLDAVQATSDDEEIVSKLEDHISENSELSSEDDKPEIEFTSSFYLNKDKSIQYRNEPSLEGVKRFSK